MKNEEQILKLWKLKTLFVIKLEYTRITMCIWKRKYFWVLSRNPLSAEHKESTNMAQLDASNGGFYFILIYCIWVNSGAVSFLENVGYASVK